MKLFVRYREEGKKILELPDTEIALESFTFPSGEVHMRLGEEIDTDKAHSFLIKPDFTLGNISDEILRILMVSDAIDQVYLAKRGERLLRDTCVTIDMTYLPFARQDRVATPGDCVSKEMLLNILQQGASRFRKKHSVTFRTLDLHSHSTNGLDYNIHNRIPVHGMGEDDKFLILVQPDKGAKERTRLVYDKMWRSFTFLDGIVIPFDKRRDSDTGKLTGFQLVYEREDDVNVVKKVEEFNRQSQMTGLPNPPIVIYDDICDGGGTFIAEAKTLKALFPNNPLICRFAHGLFTKGVEPLLEVFDEVQCFNLMNPDVADMVTVLPVADNLAIPT